MMNNLTNSDNGQEVELIFQQILSLSSQCDSYFYLIYQPNDCASTFADLIVEKSLTLFEYESYKIKYTPGLIELNLTQDFDKQILKQSIYQFFSSLDPKAILLAKPRLVYGWLLSSLSADVLAKQLGKVAVQPSTDGDQLLRYFDPAILSPLATIFTQAQKDKLLNSVYYWLYLDGDGYLIIEKNERILRKQISNHLGISLQQWQAIAWIESRNQALARYRFFHPNLSFLAEKEADKIIFQAFLHASANGYSEKRDLSEYAYRCLAIHPNFIEHPIVKSTIKQNKTHSLINQLHNISQSQWDVIVNECRVNQTGVEQ
ncbi:DUF4123 domain-containing protein [Orbus wheelerorum]|uniref:hypothetical protein n=1 Tax=Orbus wheelerorum TaxID=3074111 RepID=UPI00370DBDD6